MTKTYKPKKCSFSQCRKPFTPVRPFQVVCINSIECAVGYNVEKRAKKFKAETAEMKKALRAKDRRYQLKKAQPAFNAYIRERDYHLACISCGRENLEVNASEGWKVGGAWDCGHFLSIGSHEELRFEETNAHKQCKSCNGGSGNYTRKNHTVKQDYREKLIDRIGLDQVEWLEGPHEPKRYTAAELIEITKIFRSKKKALLETVQFAMSLPLINQIL